MKRKLLKIKYFYFFYKLLKILRNKKPSFHYGEFAEDFWTVSIDISVEKSLRGKGLSREIVHQGVEHIKTIWKENLFILACVLNTNGASNSCFKNSGFKMVEPSIDGITRWYKVVECSR